MDDNNDNASSSSSLLGQLQNRLKGGLKPTTTKTTFADGSVQYSSCQGASCESKETGTAFGFVVDEKPDLTVGPVTPWLMVSSQDVPGDPKILDEYDISCVLSLLPGFVLPPETANLVDRHLVLEVYDEESFDLESDIINQAFTFINEARKSHRRVLVHCNAGISRAPTLAIAYLMKEENFPLDRAWARVKLVRPTMRPNEGFVKQLQELDKKLNKFSLNVPNRIQT